MLLPIPEVQSVPIFIRGHILQVEPRLIGPGRRKLSADHDVVARLIPEVIVVDLACGLLLPASGNVEVFIQQQEPARAIFFGVAQHRDHHLPIRQTMDGMRSAQVRPGLDLLWLDDLVELGRALIGGIQDVNAARAQAPYNQEAPRLALIVMAGAASVPAKMMQFIIQARQLGAVDDLGVRRRCGVDIHRRQIVRRLDAGAAIEAYRIQGLFLLGLHGLLRRGIAWSAVGMIFMLHFIFICHTCQTLLSLYERTLTVSSLSIFTTLFALNGHTSSTWSGVYSSSIVMCDRSLTLKCLRAVPSIGPLPPRVYLKSAVF